MTDASSRNIDPAEQARFEALAASWWDPQGPSRPLHDLNPARLAFICERAGLRGAVAVDVGCGGGILSEALAAEGAEVTALDIAPGALAVARLHLLESGLEVDYQQATVEQWADRAPGGADLVTCMEMLEHVPDPQSVLSACARLLKPGGQAFFSTLNRTPAAFALAIVGAEHIARLLPRGTHRYDRFIRPSELAAGLRQAGFNVHDICGLQYNPVTRITRLGGGVAVNYLLHASLPVSAAA